LDLALPADGVTKNIEEVGSVDLNMSRAKAGTCHTFSFQAE